MIDFVMLAALVGLAFLVWDCVEVGRNDATNLVKPSSPTVAQISSSSTPTGRHLAGHPASLQRAPGSHK